MKKIAKNKIREIAIDLEPYNFKLRMMLVLFNVLILTIVIYLVFLLNHWIIWVIDIAIISIVSISSHFTYKRSKDYRCYTLYENALTIDNRFVYAEIDLSKLFSIKKKRSLIDRACNRPATALTIKLINGETYDVAYLKEDLDSLIVEIHSIANKYNEKE